MSVRLEARKALAWSTQRGRLEPYASNIPQAPKGMAMGRADHVDATIVVLVVEDDVMIREDVAGYLGAAGYLVLEAESGESALSQCDAAVRVDILFTDISLGGAATGWDVAEAFRIAHPDVGVIYTSGHEQGRERRVPESLFFGKPNRSGDIIGACRQLIGVA